VILQHLNLHTVTICLDLHIHVQPCPFNRNFLPLHDPAAALQCLNLQLSEGFELWLDSSDGHECFAGFNRLRSLTLSGGTFTQPAGQRLLQGLVMACPQLEELHVLPEARCGLGDDDVQLLGQLQRLKVKLLRFYIS
jgi:hypothetical protein